MPRKKRVDPIPEEFASYEEAAEFWDTHDTRDYPDAFRPVKATIELRRRRYEIEIDEDVFMMLCQQAQGIPIGQFANMLLRQALLAEVMKTRMMVVFGLFGLSEDRTKFPHPSLNVLK